jgi:hypothetical protein
MARLLRRGGPKACPEYRAVGRGVHHARAYLPGPVIISNLVDVVGAAGQIDQSDPELRSEAAAEV